MTSSLTPFDRVYRGISRAIYEEHLFPGQRLSAPKLMTQFEVGRGTVREAINRLVAAGVLTMARNHSATVRIFSREDMLDLLDIVGALLRLASQRAARHIESGGRTDKIEDIFAEIRKTLAMNDLVPFAAAREAYYREILGLCDNRELTRLFPAIHVHLMRMQLRDEPMIAQSARLADFETLHALLLAGDSVGAGDAAALHVWSMTSAVKNLPDRFFR